MKNKKLTYLLGLAVLGVWGMIIYRLFNAVGGDDNQFYPTTIKRLPMAAFNDYTIPKDTTHLLLNYRDPFSSPKVEPTEIPINELVHKPIQTPVQSRPMINWSIVKYTGFIHNPGSKRLIAMMNINGKEMMLGEGETAEQVKLVKNLKDSVKVTYQGASKYITMNTKGQ